MDEENMTTEQAMQTQQAMRAQQNLPIGEKQIGEAMERLRKYKTGKAALDERVVNAEEWWKNNHWERFGSESSKGIHPHHPPAGLR